MLKNLISGLTGRLKKPADAADDEAVVPTPFTELAPTARPAGSWKTRRRWTCPPPWALCRTSR